MRFWRRRWADSRVLKSRSDCSGAYTALLIACLCSRAVAQRLSLRPFGTGCASCFVLLDLIDKGHSLCILIDYCPVLK
jgi:hypothetical protein